MNDGAIETAGATDQMPAAPSPKPAPPAKIVIFGALGDLTRRLLMPALVNLRRQGLQDEETQVIGIGRDDLDDAGFRVQMENFIEGADAWERLRAHVTYLRGDFTEDATFTAIKERVDGSAVFYLATPPDFFGPIVAKLGGAGLLDQGMGFRRVVIEKPFGHDLASAQDLNQCLLEHAREEQIYRIDHFLGKETVQNILVARFGNAVFKSMWTCGSIKAVEITAAETVTVGKRGQFYDHTGALRDMVPNHLCQLLALIAMEAPVDFSADAVRDAKSAVLAAVRPIQPEDAVRGRYGAGKIGVDKVSAYSDAEDVDPKGTTETYVALKATIDTPRWKDVPFYLRTGKALAARDTEIVVTFKAVERIGFGDNDLSDPPANRLVLQLQPDEGIGIDVIVKTPGPLVTATPVRLEFLYKDVFDLGHRTGYETLLYDVLIGDQTLFQRADQIEGGWRAVQPVLEAWAKDGAPDPYDAGSTGPASADALLARDGRAWHPIG